MEYNKQVIKLIVGLGNPGPEYETTYHNVGVMALEHLAAAGDATRLFRRHGDSFAYAKRGECIFVRPLVFMNESGIAVRDAVRAFGANPDEIAVIHDESDLPLGEYKYVFGGGSAGHKGVQSVIDHLHTPDFWRARIGVRDPQELNRTKAGDFVLGHVTHSDMEKLGTIFEMIGKELALTGTRSPREENPL